MIAGARSVSYVCVTGGAPDGTAGSPLPPPEAPPVSRAGQSPTPKAVGLVRTAMLEGRGKSSGLSEVGTFRSFSRDKSNERFLPKLDTRGSPDQRCDADNLANFGPAASRSAVFDQWAWRIRQWFIRSSHSFTSSMPFQAWVKNLRFAGPECVKLAFDVPMMRTGTGSSSPDLVGSRVPSQTRARMR